MENVNAVPSTLGASTTDGGTHKQPLWIPWKAVCDEPKARVRMAMVVTHVGTSAIDCTRSGEDYAEDCANARRVAACVNACNGIPTEDLERWGVSLIEKIREDEMNAKKKVDGTAKGTSTVAPKE